MHAETQDAMRTALRQAGAITAVDGQHSIRQTLHLAHRLYDAILLLQPEERARRVRLIDAMFTPAAHRVNFSTFPDRSDPGDLEDLAPAPPLACRIAGCLQDWNYAETDV